LAVTGVGGRNPTHTGASEGPPHPTMPSECAVPFLFLLVSRLFLCFAPRFQVDILLHPKLLVPVETIAMSRNTQEGRIRRGSWWSEEKKYLKCYERNCATETLTMLQSGKLSLVLVVDDLFVVDDAAAPCACRRPQRKSRLTDIQGCFSLFSRSRGRRQSEEKKRRRPPPVTAEAARGTGVVVWALGRRRNTADSGPPSVRRRAGVPYGHLF
jgi:hypothetical protein